jgi:putative transposase
MAKPYSMDLRERAVLRVVRGESVRAIAQALSVSPSSVVKWSQRFRATGSAAPSKMGGNRRPKIVDGHRLWLLKRISTAGFTLRGLVAELAERGLKVDYRTVWKFVHSEGLSFKKRASKRLNGNGRTSPGGAPGGRSIKAVLIPGVWSSSTRHGRRPTWSRCAAGRRKANVWWRKFLTAIGKP